jgi:hypothetical protein
MSFADGPADSSAAPLRLPRLLALLDRAGELQREEMAQATVELVDGLLATDRSVRRVQVDVLRRCVAVTIGNVIVRLAVTSAGQALALRQLCQEGDVQLALGLVLDDGRAMLGFSGPEEDVLVTARIDAAA